MRFLFFLIAASLVLPATALAEGGEHHRGGDGMGGGHFHSPGHIMRIADELDLRDDQRESIRELLSENREEIQQVRQNLREEMGTLHELMMDDSASRQQVLAQLDRVLELEGQIKRHRAEMMLDIRDILDADQRARAHELFQERREEAGEQRRERRQNRRQHRQRSH